jgi:circadian clock protein KaiC
MSVLKPLPIPKQPTGIKPLDIVLQGGIPQHSIVLVSGNSGTGKSLLSLQWLFEGSRQYNEPGLYLSLTEPTTKLLRNLYQFDFFDESLLGPSCVNIIDMRGLIEELHLLDKRYLDETDVADVINFVAETARSMKAKRIVIDSITSLLYRYKDKDVVRLLIYNLSRALEKVGATALIISEVAGKKYSNFDVEEFIADGIINLTASMGEQSVIRRLQVVKMRGTDFLSGPMSFDLTREGILLYPRIPAYNFVAKTNFATRLSSGMPEIDSMIEGGFPEGHMILVGGNTGTGKSTVAQQFLWNGLNNGQAGVFIAFEESVEQVKKTALEHDWDFDKFQKQGQLKFVATDLIDIKPDRILKQVIDAVEATGAKLVVLDSVSSFETATMTPEMVREFLLQLSYFLKSRGACCVMTYLTAGMFEARAGQLLGSTTSNDYRLSSIVDGIILLRYVERDQEVRKLVNVLKMRGTSHDKSIRAFDITHAGAVIGDKFRL